jgi:hypothetical protein
VTVSKTKREIKDGVVAINEQPFENEDAFIDGVVSCADDVSNDEFSTFKSRRIFSTYPRDTTKSFLNFQQG